MANIKGKVKTLAMVKKRSECKKFVLILVVWQLTERKLGD